MRRLVAHGCASVFTGWLLATDGHIGGTTGATAGVAALLYLAVYGGLTLVWPWIQGGR